MRRLPLLLLLATGCAVVPVSPRRMVTLEERVATLEKRMDEAERAAPSFSQRLGGPEASDAVASVGTWVPVQAARLSAFGARNSSGTFSLATGNPVVTGTSITSTWANNTLSDIASELTDSLNRSGKGGMLAGLKLFSGTSVLPGLYFGVNTGIGWFESGSTWRFVTTGAVTTMDLSTTATFYRGATFSNTSSGSGLSSTGTGTGTGVAGTGGTTDGAGVTGTGGATNGPGVTGNGTGTGAGVVANGGSSNGAGVSATGGTANGNGVVGVGTGGGNGGDFTAGATGIGLHVTGGATSGTAFKLDVGNTVSPPFRFGTSAAPSGAAIVGDMYMTTAGFLKVCVTAGTPCASWQTVGVQTP